MFSRIALTWIIWISVTWYFYLDRQSQQTPCNQQKGPQTLDPERQLQPVGQQAPLMHVEPRREAVEPTHHPHAKRGSKPWYQRKRHNLDNLTSTSHYIYSVLILPFAMTARTKRGLAAKLFFQWRPLALWLQTNTHHSTALTSQPHWKARKSHTGIHVDCAEQQLI